MLDDILFTMDTHLSLHYGWFEDYLPDLMPPYVWRALVSDVERPARRMDDLVEVYDASFIEQSNEARWNPGASEK